MAWGNLTGIRVGGHLVEFGSGLNVVQPEWSAITRAAKERQATSNSRNGKVQTVKVQMAPRRDPQAPVWVMSATKVVEETGPGAARIDVEFTSKNEADIAGVYLRLDLPASQFSGSTLEPIEPAPPAAGRVSLAPRTVEQNEYLRATARGARITAPRREAEVMFAEPTKIIVRDDRRTGGYDLQVFLAVISGQAAEGQTAKKSFTLNPENLRVAWGRVEMPWRLWHPEEDGDPLEAARAGKLNPGVHAAMDMARRLAQRGMPVIVSDWGPPA